jgi:hypothetical protein
LYTFVHIYEQLVPPDSWFTYELEVITREYRGAEIPHTTITLGGSMLYQFLDHGNTWKERHFAFQQHDPGSRLEIRKVKVLELP